MKVKDCMTRAVVVAEPQTPIRDADHPSAPPAAG